MLNIDSLQFVSEADGRLGAGYRWLESGHRTTARHLRSSVSRVAARGMTALALALALMRMRMRMRMRLRLLSDNGVVTTGNVLLGGPPDTSLLDLLG